MGPREVKRWKRPIWTHEAGVLSMRIHSSEVEVAGCGRVEVVPVLVRRWVVGDVVRGEGVK